MATELYLPKPHRACGSTRIICEIIDELASHGKYVGVVVPTNKIIYLLNLKHKSKIRFAFASDTDELIQRFRGMKPDVIFVLDSDYIAYNYMFAIRLFTNNIIIEKNTRIENEIYNT